MPFDPIVQIELRVIVEQIRSLNQSIAELEESISEEASSLEGHQNLISIKGIGKITSAVLLSASAISMISLTRAGWLLTSASCRVTNSNESERSGHKAWPQARAHRL